MLKFRNPMGHITHGTVLRIVLFIAMMISLQTMYGQDKIIATTGKIIKCTVTKVGDTYIEYLNPQEDFGRIKKEKVKEIEFSENARKPIDYADNTAKAIKFNLFSLVNNAIQFSYESALDPNSSIEFTVKVFGVSLKDFPEAKTGGGFDIGYRLRLGDFMNASQKVNNTHVLDGIGLKPVVGISYAEVKNDEATEKYYYVHAGTILNYQVVFNNRILFEAYGGAHVFKGKNTVEFPNTVPLRGVSDFKDGDLIGSDSVAYSFGFKVGYLFGGFGRSERLLRW